MNTTRPRINRQKINAAISNMRGGPKRLTSYLSSNGPSYTGEVSGACAIGNISAAAHIANIRRQPPWPVGGNYLGRLTAVFH